MQNNWFVITGGPCSGKTTLIEGLQRAGFHTEEESARMYIEDEMAKGKTLEEVRADEEAFQQKVYQYKIDREEILPPKEIIFFDRGVPDTFAYYWHYDIPISEEMEVRMTSSAYRKVFLLEQVGYEKDQARAEDEAEAKKLHKLTKEAYERTLNEVVVVPLLASKEERLLFVLKTLESDGVVTGKEGVLV